MIDWTQPIETTETPPRPVRVLATDAVRHSGAPVVVVVQSDDGDTLCMSDEEGNAFWWGLTDQSYVTLRNVAPPKPEPVLREMWFGLYSDGSWCGHETENDMCDPSPGRVDVFHKQWMSDGSPVPGEDDPVRYGVCETCVEKAVKRCDELLAERDSLKAEVETLIKANGDLNRVAFDETGTTWEDRDMGLKAEVERMRPFNRDVEVLCHKHGLEVVGLKAEIARMRPVVDAAVAWTDEWLGAAKSMALREAVDAYQNTPKKTAEEAVANVAAMMGPVKSCKTCRFRTNATFDECAFVRRLTVECSLSNFSKWEAKND